MKIDLERFPITWNHVIEKKSLKFKELEHVLIEKVEQLFRDMLYMADAGRSHRGAMEASRTVMPGSGAGGDWLRRIGTGNGNAGRPGATVKLKIVETAFSARDVGAERSALLILLARLCLERGRPKRRKPSRSSPPSFPAVQQEANTPYNILCAHEGCPCMEHGRYSGTIENVITTQLQEGAADGKLRRFHAMSYGARNIWGVTTGILRNHYERLDS